MAQFVYLVHHAQALSGEIDHTRPLSTVGLRQAESVARGAVERGAKPVAIWHSGKLRARQTAEAWLRLVNPFATFAAVRGLQPDDDPDIVGSALLGETRDVVIASHMPLLPVLLHRLETGRHDRLSAPFPLNGCVALERAGDLWQERWTIAPEV
jgi:phosphohistidine phosphatase